MKTTASLERFWLDLQRKEFIPLKLLYFMVYGGLFSLIPFLSLQARALGIRSEEFGAISGILPLLGIVCSALAGMIADKMGNFKLFLSFAMVASGLTALIFLAIPVARITYHLPEMLPLELNCTSNSDPQVSVAPPYECDLKTPNVVYARLSDCHYDCPDQRAALTIPSKLDNRMCSLIPECSASSDKETFLSSWTYNRNSSLFDASLIHQSYMPIRLQASAEAGSTKLNSINTVNSCPDFSKLGFATAYISDNSTTDSYPSCSLRCKVEVKSEDLCSNEICVQEMNPALTIVIYVLCMFLQQLTLISALPLFEGATIAILKEKKGDIGLQRLYSNIGKLVMTPLSGLLVDAFSEGDETNFKPAIYMYCVINFLSSLCIVFIDLRFKKPAKGITRAFKRLLFDFEVITFLVVGLVVGVATGVIDTFLFWILDDMGASTTLMGMTVTVGSIFGVVILVFATSIIDKLGHINTLCLGMVFFVIRLLGYTFIADPWWAMPFEAMECFTTALYGVAQASYITFLSTTATIVSLQGLSVGISHGLGRGLGSMMGGFMAKDLGLRMTYRIMAIICGIFAVAYFALNIIIFKKNVREREEEPPVPNETEDVGFVPDGNPSKPKKDVEDDKMEIENR